MSYTPNTWQTGDTITAAKLNNMEQGVANAGGVLLVNATVSGRRVDLDKTWQEINDSTLAVIKMDGQIMRVYMTDVMDSYYAVVVGIPNEVDGKIVLIASRFSTTTASGYPFLLSS